MTPSSPLDLSPNLERLRLARREARDTTTTGARADAAMVDTSDKRPVPQMRGDQDENLSHRFAVGHMVQFSGPHGFITQAPGTYEVMAQIPERDGEPQYRVKSTLEAYQRVVREGLLESGD